MRKHRTRPGVLERVGQSMTLGLLLAARTAAAEPCLRYEPAVVQLEGRLARQVFPGRPNFESVPQGDEPEQHWVLRLSKPACVLASPSDAVEWNEDEYGVASLQLVIDDYERWRSLIGKTVRVTGTLMHAITAHHHTDVLVFVSNIEQVRGAVR